MLRGGHKILDFMPLGGVYDRVSKILLSWRGGGSQKCGVKSTLTFDINRIVLEDATLLHVGTTCLVGIHNHNNVNQVFV